MSNKQGRTFWESAGAELSECKRYRYKLWREWDRGLSNMVFCMLNPSTADAEEDDPTIRRCMGFARDLGFGGITVINLYAIRSKSPDAIKMAGDPVGPENDNRISEATLFSRGQVVCAWGSNADPVRAAHVVGIIHRASAETYCFGVNKDGSPKHPLYLPKSADLIPYPVQS